MSMKTDTTTLAAKNARNTGTTWLGSASKGTPARLPACCFPFVLSAFLCGQSSGFCGLGEFAQGIQSIECCPNGFVDAQSQPVVCYMIIGSPANRGPLEKEIFDEKYSLYSWTGGGKRCSGEAHR